MDIVLIDAGEPFGKGTLLPSGRLREPLYSLGRADIIVLTKTGETPEDGSGRLDNLYAEIRKYNQRCHIFRADHAPSACKLINGSEKPIGWLSGKKVFGFCALGCPESFLRTLRFSGADVVGFRYFRDHHAYGFEDISAIKTEAERVRAGWIVTTEKDIIKTRDLDLHGNVAVVSISFSIEEGFYEEVFGRQVG
jgi:tetraacyldisaccharide 4'-kinase